jgi:hypothetical protein
MSMGMNSVMISSPVSIAFNQPLIVMVESLSFAE